MTDYAKVRAIAVRLPGDTSPVLAVADVVLGDHVLVRGIRLVETKAGRVLLAPEAVELTDRATIGVRVAMGHAIDAERDRRERDARRLHPVRPDVTHAARQVIEQVKAELEVDADKRLTGLRAKWAAESTNEFITTPDQPEEPAP